MLAVSNTPLDRDWEGGTLGAALLAPTRIYVRALLQLLQTCKIQGLAHITGVVWQTTSSGCYPPR